MEVDCHVFTTRFGRDNSDFLSGNPALALVIGGSLLAGLVVILGRSVITSGEGDPPASIVRSWIAVALVFGFLAFCAAALLINNATLQSMLFGGLIASLGSAVAFYFSSKTADQALSTAVTMSQGGTKPSVFSELAPPDGTVGTLYTYRFVANGRPAPSYRLASGSLPTELVLDPDGTLHGTPTVPNAYTFSVAASNPAGLLLSPQVTLTIT